VLITLSTIEKNPKKNKIKITLKIKIAGCTRQSYGLFLTINYIVSHMGSSWP